MTSERKLKRSQPIIILSSSMGYTAVHLRSLSEKVIYSVKMHCTRCKNWSWLFPMMLAYPPDRCYDRNLPWEASQSQGIVQGISNSPSQEAGKCQALPPGRCKAGIKSQHNWDQLQSSAWAKFLTSLVLLWKNLILLCPSLLAGAIFFPNLKIQQVN